MSRPQRLGLFGGSFNPIHFGHLVMAENAHDRLGLDQVLFAPAGNPPHKADQDLASDRDRLAMVRLAIAGNEGFAVSDLDLGREEPSFTWQLLKRLRDHAPEAALWFIMGGDSLADFPGWSRPEQILELARVAVIDRPGVALDERHLDPVQGLRASVDRIDAPLCSVSSTEIRRRIGHGETVRYLVPDAVRTYIDRHGLYRTNLGTPTRQSET